MSNVLSAESLRRAAAIREQIESLEAEYQAILSGATVRRRPGPKPKSLAVAGAAPLAATDTPAAKPAKKRRKLSPEARARIVAAVKARWAREKANKA